MRDRFKEYLEDIDLAKQKIDEALLTPEKDIIYDVYAIPSHNHSTFYAQIYNDNDTYMMVYARPELDSILSDTPIRMYRFSNAQRAIENSAKKKGEYTDGRIIVGVIPIRNDLIKVFEDIKENVSENKNYKDNGITIDGVHHIIRFLNNNSVCKILDYSSVNSLLITEGKEYLKNNLENMYLIIEDIINYN